MDVLTSFLCVAGGIALDATYNYLRRKGEWKAYCDGYDKAKDNERMCKQSYEEGKAAEQVSQMMHGVYPKHAEGKHSAKVPESFVERLNNNGQATMKLK